MKGLFIVAFSCSITSVIEACTVTTASGTRAPKSFCSGDLIFEDNFDSLDQGKWKHAQTMAGGGNNEFQWYVNDRANSYTSGGNLHLKPTFTSDIYGEGFLSSGKAVIPSGECTDSSNWGCDRTGFPDSIINPIRSAKVESSDSFSFKFGTLEIRARMPLGDWLWPALWLMPKKSVYGGWPASGEIDLVECRGNHNLWDGNTNVGVEHVASTMHFGPPCCNGNGWPTAHFTKNRTPGFDSDFHNYKLVWSQNEIAFYVDNEHIGTVQSGNGFWEREGFSGNNPWQGGTKMAPFDQEFYIIFNNAIGGTMYFPEKFENRNGGKPWSNDSPHGKAMADFWNGKAQWESSWNRHGSEQSHLQIDYVRVWAL